MHVAYQLMLGLGMAMMGTSLLGVGLWAWRRGLPTDPWFLHAMVALAPAGIVAVEAGWVVTEVGRQPWIIQGVMRTSDAVTPAAGVTVTFWFYLALYVFLAVMTALLLRRQFHHAPSAEEHTP